MRVNHVKVGTVVSKHGYKGDIKISVSSNNLDTFSDLKYSCLCLCSNVKTKGA